MSLDSEMPIAHAPGLYHPALEVSLAKTCVPLDAARPGELVGMVMDYQSTEQIRLMPITVFLVIDDCGKIRAHPLEEIRSRDAAARLAMTAHRHHEHTTLLQDVISDFEDPDSFSNYITVFAFPRLAYVCHAGFAETIARGLGGPHVLPQEFIDGHMMLIAPCRIASNHEKLTHDRYVRESLPLLSDMIGAYPVSKTKDVTEEIIRQG